MKKLILTTIVYQFPEMESYSGEPLPPATRQLLVVINSSRQADENHDTEAAVSGCKAWFEKSAMYENGGRYISITAEPTIDAENPEPPVLYTEKDLVAFGNFMVKKALRITDFRGDDHLSSLRVLDSDIANWIDMQNQIKVSSLDSGPPKISIVKID